MEAVERTLSRYETLVGRRYNFDTTWQRLQELVWPFAGDFNHSSYPGEIRTEEVFESSATLALEKFAAFMESLLTPRNQKWHSLRASVPELNEVQSVKQWFELATDRLFQIRNNPKAQYYSQKHEGWKSLGCFGNDTLLVDPRPEGGIRYKHCHLGRTHVETNHDGVPDTVYYKYPLTAHQAMEKFGDRCPEDIRKRATSAPLEESDFLHIVRPQVDWDPARLDAKGKPFESMIISIIGRKLVQSGGYWEQPYLFSRYTVNPAEIYGRGPGELILPDVETLQEQEKTFQRAGHKVADPPLLLQSDGPLGRGSKRVKLIPGGLTYGGVDANGRPTVLPLQTGANLPLTETMMDQKREMISVAFLNSLFLSLVDDRERTATEILERAKEKGQLLTPTTGRQESEMLGPQITREIKILQRQGLLPPPPPELEEAEGEFDIVYDNEASRLQRSEEALAIEKTLGWTLAAVQQGADPTMLEVPDWHFAMREMGKVNGVPPLLLKSKAKVQRAVAAQAKAAQAQQGLEVAAKSAAVAKDMAAAGADVDEAMRSVAPGGGVGEVAAL